MFAGNFPQQIDPFTAIPEPGDGYGPMIMSLLEYTALRVGVVPRPDLNALLWSGLQPTSGTPVGYVYTQRLGDHNFTLALGPTGNFTASRNGVVLFYAAGGLRVVTTLRGDISEVWGIADTVRDVTVARPGGAPLHITLAPNDEWEVDLDAAPPTSKRVRAVPFYAPY